MKSIIAKDDADMQNITIDYDGNLVYWADW
jgi:hypothetical protein